MRNRKYIVLPVITDTKTDSNNMIKRYIQCNQSYLCLGHQVVDEIVNTSRLGYPVEYEHVI